MLVCGIVGVMGDFRENPVRKVQVRKNSGSAHVTLWYERGREFTYTYRKNSPTKRAMALAEKISRQWDCPMDVIDQRSTG